MSSFEHPWWQSTARKFTLFANLTKQLTLIYLNSWHILPLQPCVHNGSETNPTPFPFLLETIFVICNKNTFECNRYYIQHGCDVYTSKLSTAKSPIAGRKTSRVQYLLCRGYTHDWQKEIQCTQARRHTHTHRGKSRKQERSLIAPWFQVGMVTDKAHLSIMGIIITVKSVSWDESASFVIWNKLFYTYAMHRHCSWLNSQTVIEF